MVWATPRSTTSPDGVAVRVVDVLEVVDVDEGDRQRPLVAAGALHLGEEGAEQRLRLTTPVRRSMVARSWVSARAAAMPLTARARRPSRPLPRACTRDRVVAGRDPLGGLHEAPEPDPHQEVQRARRDRHADGRRSDRGDHGTAHGIDPGGGDLRDRDKEDPESDRSRQRQDPKQAHHSAKARAGPPPAGSPAVPVMPRRWYRCIRAPPHPGPSGRASAGGARRGRVPCYTRPVLVRSGSRTREPGGQRSRLEGASAAQ